MIAELILLGALGAFDGPRTITKTEYKDPPRPPRDGMTWDGSRWVSPPTPNNHAYLSPEWHCHENWRKRQQAQEHFAKGFESLMRGDREWANYEFKNAIALDPSQKQTIDDTIARQADMDRKSAAEKAAQFAEMKADRKRFYQQVGAAIVGVSFFVWIIATIQ